MKRHWYLVEIKYYRGNTVLFDGSINVGLIDQQEILDHRRVKKWILPDLVKKDSIRYTLCNGKFRITNVSYLGRFKGGPTIWDYLNKKFNDFFDHFMIYSVIKDIK